MRTVDHSLSPCSLEMYTSFVITSRLCHSPQTRRDASGELDIGWNQMLFVDHKSTYTLFRSTVSMSISPPWLKILPLHKIRLCNRLFDLDVVFSFPRNDTAAALE